MAGLIAWLLTLVLMMAWVAMSSPLWLACAIFGWKRQAQAVAVGPMRPLQRSLERACGGVHEWLWGRLGWWTAAIYAVIVAVLMIIGSTR